MVQGATVAEVRKAAWGVLGMLLLSNSSSGHQVTQLANGNELVTSVLYGCSED